MATVAKKDANLLRPNILIARKERGVRVFKEKREGRRLRRGITCLDGTAIII